MTAPDCQGKIGLLLTVEGEMKTLGAQEILWDAPLLPRPVIKVSGKP